MFKELFYWLSPTGRRIGAIDNRWTSCQENDRARVAREGIAELNQILTQPNIDSDFGDWATNLRAVMEQYADDRNPKDGRR